MEFRQFIKPLETTRVSLSLILRSSCEGIRRITVGRESEFSNNDQGPLLPFGILGAAGNGNFCLDVYRAHSVFLRSQP